MAEQKTETNVTKVNLWLKGEDAGFGMMVLFMGLGIGGCEVMTRIGQSYERDAQGREAIMQRLDQIEKKIGAITDREEILNSR